MLAGILTACGSDPAPGPTEQIIVREPGETVTAEVVVDPITSAANPEAAIITQGKAAFGTCAGCHAVDKDAAAMVGPHLHGVVGRKAAALEDYGYSDALVNSGLTWTPEELDKYLANPVTAVPGTSMMAGGVTDPQRRAAIIAYLVDVSAN